MPNSILKLKQAHQDTLADYRLASIYVLRSTGKRKQAFVKLRRLLQATLTKQEKEINKL